MFQRKLIVVMSLIALLALTAGVSQASLSRVEALGLSSPTSSMHVDDYANIYYFPTSVVRQNNLVLAELGNAGLGEQSFTVIRNFPRFGAIAYQMKQNQTNTPYSNNLNNHQLDLIWGKAFTKVDFAVRLDITNSSFETSTTAGNTVSKAQGWGFSVGDPYPFGGALFANSITGTGVELNTVGIMPSIAIHMENDDRLEAAVSYRNYTLDRSTSTGGVAGEKWENDGSASYAVVARWFMNKGDKHVWVPAGWYSNDDFSWRVSNFGGVANETRSADETYKSFGVGISDNMRVNDNNMLIWGVQVRSDKHEYDRTDTAISGSGDVISVENKESTTPMVFAALETDATKWLKVRMGAHQSYFSNRDETTVEGAPSVTTTSKYHYSSFDFSLGTGIRWNNLDVDMTMNENFPHSGGYILSGITQYPFFRVSGTYHF